MDPRARSPCVRLITGLRGLLMYINLATVLVLHVNSAAIPDDTVVIDENPVLLMGRQGDLQCRFNGIPMVVFWEKDQAGTENKEHLITWYEGRKIYRGHEGVYDIKEDYSLLIYNVTDHDAGRYQCRVSIEGVISIGQTDVTVKVPPRGLYPTIDKCRHSSNQLCFLNVEHHIPVIVTCRTEGATIGLVSLQWTHSCSHGFQPLMVASPNPDGQTEIIESTITVLSEYCKGEFVCVAEIHATRVEPKTAAIVVNFTIGETSTIKDITDILPQKGTNVFMIVVIVLVLLILVVLIAGIICYCRRKGHKSPGRSDIKMPKRGLILYWDLWMLVNLKPEDETYLQKLNEMVAHLMREEDKHNKDLNINSLYQQLCAWKKSCKDNAQEEKLRKAMKNNGLLEEYQQIKELRKNTTDAELAEDLSHICWWLRDIGRTVTVEGDYLSFHHLSNQSEEHEMNEFNYDSLVAKEIETLRAWREEFIKRHCRYQINGLDDENETLLNVTKPLNPNMEVCRALEEAGLHQIAQTMFLIPYKYKRLSDEDMETFAKHITQRHCNFIGGQVEIQEEIIIKRNSENVTALFDTAAMLKESSRRYGNYALRCKLRKIAEKLDRADQIKDAFIDHASSVTYQPSGITETVKTDGQPDTSTDSKVTQEPEELQTTDEPPLHTISDKLVTPMSEEYNPPRIRNDRVYYAEVVPVAYCILFREILPFAEGLGIDRNQLDQYRPPRNNLHQGTSGLLLDVLRKIENENSNKTRSRFADVLGKAGFEDAAKLITYDYELSMTVLMPIMTDVSSKILHPDDYGTVGNVTLEPIKGLQIGTVWQVMTEWKRKLRPEPYHYQLELKKSIKQVNIISDLPGQDRRKNPSTPSVDVLKSLISDAGSDKVWNVIGVWCSDGKGTEPTIENMAIVAQKEIILIDRDIDLQRINALFLSGLFDMAYEYAILKRVYVY